MWRRISTGSGTSPDYVHVIKQPRLPKASEASRHQGIIRYMLRCMRKTLTLDDDVAAELDELRRSRSGNFKELVNQALREGLNQLRSQSREGKPFRTESVDLGRLKIGSIDNVAEALAVAESEAYR
jgi:hypothetical protein